MTYDTAGLSLYCRYIHLKDCTSAFFVCYLCPECMQWGGGGRVATNGPSLLIGKHYGSIRPI